MEHIYLSGIWYAVRRAPCVTKCRAVPVYFAVCSMQSALRTPHRIYMEIIQAKLYAVHACIRTYYTTEFYLCSRAHRETCSVRQQCECILCVCVCEGTKGWCRRMMACWCLPSSALSPQSCVYVWCSPIYRMLVVYIYACVRIIHVYMYAYDVPYERHHSPNHFIITNTTSSCQCILLPVPIQAAQHNHACFIRCRT